jgi:hypothetical protein
MPSFQEMGTSQIGCTRGQSATASINNLALLLPTSRPVEAEPLSRRAVAIVLGFTHRTGHEHPHLRVALANHAGFLRELGRSEADIQAELDRLKAGRP